MPLTTNSFRNAWMAIVIAMAMLALPAFAQDPTGGAARRSAGAGCRPRHGCCACGRVGARRCRHRQPADSPEISVTGEPPADTRALDETVQELKKDVVDLNKELFVLEEELLFPANTQVAVFVSMDIGEFFALDSLTLKIDNKEVANYMYTPREAEALLKGGVHRVYLGNLKVGEHQLVAFFAGKGPNDRDYKRGANHQVREGRRRQVPRAQDHRPPAQGAARVRDQGLGIGLRVTLKRLIQIAVVCGAVGALAPALVPQAMAAKKEVDKLSPTVVRDLHFGDALFYYYQAQDFEAITRLQAYRAVGPHAASRCGDRPAARRPLSIARPAQRGR